MSISRSSESQPIPTYSHLSYTVDILGHFQKSQLIDTAQVLPAVLDDKYAPIGLLDRPASCATTTDSLSIAVKARMDHSVHNSTLVFNRDIIEHRASRVA